MAALAAAAPGASAATFGTTTSVPAAIADGTASTPPAYGATTALSFTVAGVPSGTIDDVEVTLSTNHTYVGDLDVVLVAPGGSPTQTIFSRTGATTVTSAGSGANLTGPYTFADSAPATPTWWAASTGLTVASGSYRASTPGGAGTGGTNQLITPTFAGLSTANGTWTLNVRDGASTDTGSVTAAAITVHTVADTTTALTRPQSGVGVGDPFTFDDTVTGTRGSATGTEKLEIYGPDVASCSGTPAFSTTRPYNPFVEDDFATFTPTQQGVYRGKVSYGGDAENGASTSTCGAAVTVGPAFVPFDAVDGQALDAGASVTGSGRPYRSGTASYCGQPNVAGASGAGPYHYKAYAHANTASTPNCVRATVETASCASGIFVQSYAAPFDAGSLTTRYLGDAGSSGAHASSMYTAAAGESFQDVVFETTANAGCAGYKLTWASTRPWSGAPPTVPGAPQATVPTVAANGSWSGSPTFGYTWRRCAADGTGCADIGGASGQSYTPTDADVGKRLAVTVSASFADQTTIVASAPSAVVAAAPPAPPVIRTPTTPVVPAAPAIALTGVKQSAATWRVGTAQAKISAAKKKVATGTTFSFTVNQAASVKLSFAALGSGRKASGKCVKTTKANAKKPRCTLAKAAGAVTLAAKRAGATKVTFQGLLSAGKKLKPGRYTVVISATAGGRTATAKALAFTIVR